MLEVWKTITILETKDNPVAFDALERKYSKAYTKAKGYLPFIILYDKQEGYYYCLRQRIANHKKYKYEVYVPSTSNDSFNNAAYIDCSEIFKIKREELELLVDIQLYQDNNTKPLDANLRVKIIKTIKACVLKKKPALSILEVCLDNNTTKAKSLYCCDKKINQEFKKDNDRNDDPDYFDNKFNSNKSITDSYSNQRYLESIKFGFLFMKKFDNKGLTKFYKKHKLSEAKINKLLKE